MARDDDAILEELRERWDYGTDEWEPIREDGRIDVRYLGGDCFAMDPRARAARKEKNRPIVDPEEMSQYVNQLVNDVRQNKRGIKVSATGNGANDATALFRQGKIRDIEYQSNANQAYASLMENMAQRGYGFLRVRAIYLHDDDEGLQPGEIFNQDLRIEPIVNPDMVTPDPDHMRSDGTDLNWLFYEEWRGQKDFLRQFPDATTTNFDDKLSTSGGWIEGNRIRLAEYWTKERTGTRRKLMLKPSSDGAQPMEVWEDEIGSKVKPEWILKDRKIDQFQVMQYLTNGLEILERNKWPGPSIPFVCGYGKILYVDEGDGQGSKKKLMSLIRLARSSATLYAYYRTQQAEMAGMVPKVPVIGYRGQFQGVENDWEKAPHEPLAFIEANATTPETGTQILPLPQRLSYDAASQLQALELCAEGARRAIQAAIGASPLPTQAQRKNEKSGVALKEIESTAQRGSFHFTDHYDEGITRTGKILDENLEFYYDTPRETSIRTGDDEVAMVRINDAGAAHADRNKKAGLPAHVPVGRGSHDVTISVGPYLESQRDAANEFADALVGNPQIAQIVGPQKASELLAAAIRLKNLGPQGDAMAEIIAPKDAGQQDPRQLMQKAQQMQQQMQAMGQELDKRGKIIESKQVETSSREKIADAELKLKWEQMNKDADLAMALQIMKNAAGIAEAHIAAAAKGVALTAHAAEESAALGHEAVQSSQDRAHEAQMAALQAQHDRDASAQDHEEALGQGQQAADLAPPPQEAASA